MICLFHDLGYQYEYNKNVDSNKYATFEGIISEMTKRGIPSLLSKLNGIPQYFTPQLIENYYNYRKYSMGKYDHGICGGMYLFETLCRIRREEKSKLHPDDRSGRWKDELEDIFSLASSVVLCHNIFLPSEEAYLNYGQFHLEELIKLSQAVNVKQYPFNMEEYPIFFLFCLVDSIEPIKIIKDTHHLNNIFIEFDNEL